MTRSFRSWADTGVCPDRSCSQYLHTDQHVPHIARPAGGYRRLADAVERVTRQHNDEATAAASAIAQLSANLNKERARANEFEEIMGAMGREFAILNGSATELAQRAGVSPSALQELKRTWANASADPDHAAVGLHQSANDFLLKAARTAFRKAFHPDTKPENEKPTAEAMFKQNEAAFERLFRMRGLSN